MKLLALAFVSLPSPSPAYDRYDAPEVVRDEPVPPDALVDAEITNT